jgi:hypothetical protein
MTNATAKPVQEVKSTFTIDRAISRVLAEIHEGLRHGYFEYALTCEVIGQERRRLTLRAGKSHQFVISKDECQRAAAHDRDFQNGSDPDAG